MLSIAGYNWGRSRGPRLAIAAGAAPLTLLAVLPLAASPSTVTGSSALAAAFRTLVVAGQLALWLSIGLVYVRLDDGLRLPVEGHEQREERHLG